MTLDHRQVAEQLLGCYESRRPIDPPAESFPGMTIDDAYRVQRLQTCERVVRGEAPIGFKVGLTSAALRRQLNRRGAANNAANLRKLLTVPRNPSKATKTAACIRCFRKLSLARAATPKIASKIPTNAGISAVTLAPPLSKP